MTALDRLQAALDGTRRNEVTYRWVRAAIADRDFPTREVLAYMRDSGWLPSLMKQRNGTPRYWFRDEPMLGPTIPSDLLQLRRENYQRLEKRAALRARIERRAERIRAEHERIHAKPPEMRSELSSLGPYISGEPQARSRRRAQLQRALRAPVGKFSDPAPLPTSPADIDSELRYLGRWARGESAYKTRRRAALQRLSRTALAAPSSRDP